MWTGLPVGMAVFTVASLACALSESIAMLNIARAVQGAGAAILFAVSLALLSHAYPDERERAGALAVYGVTVGGSFAIGPLVGGALTSALDWQWVFLINVPIGLYCLWITARQVEESRDPTARRIDWLGQATLAAGLFLLVLALLRGLQQILGLSAVEAGLVYLPGTLAMLVTSGATASLVERVGPGVLISVGLGLIAVGMALIAVMAEVDSSWVAVLPGTVIALIGTGLFNPAVIAVALSSAPAEQSGLAAGVNDTFRQAGIAIGVAGLGALVPAEAALGGGSAVDYVNGLDNALMVGAGLAAAGAVLAAALIRRRSVAASAALVPDAA